ncbi:uncharacterized protein LOC127721471 isoform X1 [Mytilus californianus]|uniref:uncharacterized protein LOC127721471 isoform X1 n=1 Tax=Mytilus californianus TaxID=6549 RepID=UPI002247D2E9|nr:uncharacterized protein LOC127721471 isoform X1 [Mytilus californianus]
MPLKSAGRMAYKFFDGCMLGVDSTDLHSIREACRDKIIEEYSEILSLFEHMGMDNLCRAFQIEDGEIRSHNYGMTQADRLLSMIVIREGDECLSYLQKLPPKEQNILKRILRKPGKEVPGVFREKYSNVTFDVIRNFRQYLEREVEICKVIISLLEYNVISISEYTEIRNKDTRAKQRKQLIAFILNKEDLNQIIRFLFVLHEFGREDILNILLTRNTHDVVEDLQVRLSGTTVLVRIPSFPTMQPTVHDIAAAAGEHLGRILVDQWEGSIVLRLYSETENLSSLTVHLNEDKLKRFLQKMYMCVELLPNEWKRLVVEMQFIPNDKFIEDRMSISYSGTQLHDNTERNQPCSRCLQETVRQNVQTIVDELESDIITETFNNFGNASKFVKDMCLSVKFTPSRQERALRFLNFALHEEKCLREFFNVLRRRSNVNLIQAQCLRCSTTEATHAVENMEPYNQKHAMCFYLIREEGKNVVRGDKECLGPTAGFSIRDIHRRQEYWGTTSHHMQLHGDRSFEQQETASTWEEQTGTVFYPRESSTPEFGSRRYRQSREFESNPHISYKLKKSKRRKDRRRTQ